MKGRQVLKTAVFGLTTLTLLGAAATAQAVEREKCFGIALAGKNDYASKFSNHSCAGQSKVGKDPNAFKLVPTGSCLKEGGKLKAAGDPVAAIKPPLSG